MQFSLKMWVCHFESPISKVQYLSRISDFESPISKILYQISDFESPISKVQYPFSDFKTAIPKVQYLPKITVLQQMVPYSSEHQCLFSPESECHFMKFVCAISCYNVSSLQYDY